MVTLALLGLPRLTPVGNVVRIIVRSKFSVLSNMLSLFIGTPNEVLVVPAGNVTVYGPDP